MPVHQTILATVWLGIVLGSVIMKNENSSKLPVLMD